MARAKKNKPGEVEVWPKVERGSHTTRTVYEDGTVTLETHWEDLERDVRQALAAFENQNMKNKIEKTNKISRNKS